MVLNKIVFVLFFIYFYNKEIFTLNIYPGVKTIPLKYQYLNINPGEPLYLTPFLENNDVLLAKNKSQNVYSSKIYKNLISYSGYLTVNKQCDSNLFFWFFPSQNNYPEAPIILWLSGGPGWSSIRYGLLQEHGPIQIKNGKPTTREFSWNLYHSVIYIDSPVGTGFSFTKNSSCYARDEFQVANDLYEALIQFFKLFPELKQNDFFLTGESYGGKYVPALGHKIHHKNQEVDPNERINLKGLAIGNGYTDPINQLDYSDYLYQLGLLDDNDKKEMKLIESEIINLIKHKEWKEAFDMNNLLLGFTTNTSVFSTYVGIPSLYNYLQTKVENDTDVTNYLQRNDVREFLHVGNNTFNDGNLVFENMIEDIEKSVVSWVSELLSYYRLLVYNGQLDIIVAYPLTENYIKKLNFSSRNDYLKAKRHFWYVDNDLAGYVKQAGNLTEVLVRNAGHLVPFDQPKWALDLITRFVRNKPFY